MTTELDVATADEVGRQTKRRRFSLLTRRDLGILALFLGLPAFVHICLRVGPGAAFGGSVLCEVGWNRGDRDH